jgi:hypothetical protein
LLKADFSTGLQHGFLDPERNKLKGAKFSVEGALALLAKYGLKIE